MMQFPTLENPCRDVKLLRHLNQLVIQTAVSGIWEAMAQSRSKKMAHNVEVAQILESIIAISAASMTQAGATEQTDRYQAQQSEYARQMSSGQADDCNLCSLIDMLLLFSARQVIALLASSI